MKTPRERANEKAEDAALQRKNEERNMKKKEIIKETWKMIDRLAEKQKMVGRELKH